MFRTIRRWVRKFGLRFARNLRAKRPLPSGQSHLDEMVVSIGGDRQSLWQAVESEGEVLDLLVQSRRDKKSAMRLMRTLLRKQGFASPRIDCLIVGLGGSRQQEHAMLSET